MIRRLTRGEADLTLHSRAGQIQQDAIRHESLLWKVSTISTRSRITVMTIVYLVQVTEPVLIQIKLSDLKE